MSRYDGNERWVWEILKMVGLWFWLIAVGTWYLCMVATRALLEYVINPLLNGALDKHNGDALVLGLSILLWEGVALAVFGWLIVPELQGASAEEFRQALLVMLGCGLVWGVSIGFWIVLIWWSSREMKPPLHFTQVSGLPAEFYEPAPLLASTNGQ